MAVAVGKFPADHLRRDLRHVVRLEKFHHLTDELRPLFAARYAVADVPLLLQLRENAVQHRENAHIRRRCAHLGLIQRRHLIDGRADCRIVRAPMEERRAVYQLRDEVVPLVFLQRGEIDGFKLKGRYPDAGKLEDEED